RPYFLKQGVDAERMASVAREAAFYTLFHARRLDRGPGALVPGFDRYDAERHVLVLRLLTGARTLRGHYGRCRVFGRRVGAAVGRALGRVHRELAAAARPPELFATPWVLNVHRPTYDAARELAAPRRELVALIQEDAGFCELLDTLRTAWRDEG